LAALAEIHACNPNKRDVQQRLDGMQARLPAMGIAVLGIMIAAVQIVGFHRIIGIMIIAPAFLFLAVSSAACLIVATMIDVAVP
jgi:uncharacterized RDD family membrane protein YckC